MSHLKAKVVLAVMLALSAPTMGACVTPLTIDCAPLTCVL